MQIYFEENIICKVQTHTYYIFHLKIYYLYMQIYYKVSMCKYILPLFQNTCFKNLIKYLVSKNFRKKKLNYR